MKYILAFDFGTSGVKASLFTTEGGFVKTHTVAYPTYYENGSWVEQDPEDWYKAFCEDARYLTEGIDPKDIEVVGFDGTYPNCLCIDENRKPLHRCLIWQDSRSYVEAEEISRALPPEYTASRPNGILGTDRSLCKILWVKKHQPELFAKTWKILMCVQDYIILKLAGVAAISRDAAGSSALMTVDRSDWSKEVLDIAGIPLSMMPELHYKTDVVGVISQEGAKDCHLAPGTRLVIGSGDSACMTIGAHMFEPGDAYMNGGTSAGILALNEKKAKIGGQTASSGSSLSWLKNTICLAEQAEAEATGKDIYTIINEKAAKAPIGCNGVMFHPYLAGERAPRNNPRAKCSFTGISLTTSREDIIRAVIEGIGLNVNLILKEVRSHGYPLKRIPILGGLGRGDITRQILADIMDVELVLYEHTDEAATAGVAVLAGMAIGIFENEYAVEKFMKPIGVVVPNKENHEKYLKLMPLFEAVYESLKPVYEMM